MKFVAIAISFLLVGCASTPETEEMERQALETGDWSEVERLERVADKRRKRQTASGSGCADNQLSYCESLGRMEKCICASPAAARAKLYGR